MVAQQLGLHEQSIDDHQFQDPYEGEQEEDALSLCDLPLTSSSCSSSDEYFSNKENQNSSFGDGGGLFEFFSEDFTTTTYPATDKIIFCGKVIVSKGGEETTETTTDKKVQSQEFSTAKTKGGLHHNVRATSSRHQVRRSSSDRTLSSKSSLDKASVMCSFPLVKSKWFVLGFGMGRYSMEKKDIKMRQSRRAPSTMFQMVKEDDMVEENGRRRSGKGLWGLLRLLRSKKNPKTQ